MGSGGKLGGYVLNISSPAVFDCDLSLFKLRLSYLLTENEVLVIY